MFRELTEDPFYDEYKKYSRCVLDYCILECDRFEGEETHRDAVLWFMDKICKKVKEEYDENNWIYLKDMKSELVDSKSFFEMPENHEKLKNYIDTSDYHRPYWFLFLHPPYETNYTADDFNRINNILFPKGKDNLEIYDWSVDWSTYFSYGLEWWGARCTSIYDKSLNRFVVIFASATD